MPENLTPGPIGIFDSGYGGLSVFKEIKKQLGHKDFIYLGDNARAPYGTRSLEMVYRFTLEGVQALFAQGCHLVILACNTASANALRSIQQNDLSAMGEHKRVLGVIRPTTERLGQLTTTGHLGICATEATVNSGSYVIEAAKYAPEIHIHQQACPMWVPLIEYEEEQTEAATYFIDRYITDLLGQHDAIDAVLLACTHYPMLFDQIRKRLPAHIELITQGKLVADSLVDYLKRHPHMDALCSHGATRQYWTTDAAGPFEQKAQRFMETKLVAQQVSISR